MGWTREQNAFLSFASHVPVLLCGSQETSAVTSVRVQIWPRSAKRVKETSEMQELISKPWILWR
jgi:hypothetical protein